MYSVQGWNDITNQLFTLHTKTKTITPTSTVIAYISQFGPSAPEYIAWRSIICIVNVYKHYTHNRYSVDIDRHLHACTTLDSTEDSV